MPTSFSMGFGLPSGTGVGVEASQGGLGAPAIASGGNKVRQAEFDGRGRCESGSGANRNVGKVAIKCLAAQRRTIFAFCSPCQGVSSLFLRSYLQAHRLFVF